MKKYSTPKAQTEMTLPVWRQLQSLQPNCDPNLGTARLVKPSEVTGPLLNLWDKIPAQHYSIPCTDSSQEILPANTASYQPASNSRFTKKITQINIF